MFSLVTSLIHTFVSLVRKSNQASCIVIAHTEATLVLVKTYFAFRHSLMLLWLKDLMNVIEKLQFLDPTFRHSCVEFSSRVMRGVYEGTRQECRNVGSMNCNLAVTFIKSLNQKSIKPCLTVHLVAMWTLIYIYICMIYIYIYACSLDYLVRALWHGLDDTTRVRSLGVAI